VKRNYFIQQVSQQDCGPTALKVLLAYLFQKESFLFLQESWNRPSTFKNLLEYASHFGVTLKGYKLHHPSSVRGLKSPFLALMKNPNPHYVVVIPIQKDRYRLIDPAGTTKTIRSQYFDHTFSGYILLVKHIKSLSLPILPMEEVFQKGFFYMSFFLLMGLASAWFWIPSIAGLWFVILAIVIGFIWGILLFKKVKDLDQTMVKRYLPLISNPLQFERFHLWKQGWMAIPLTTLYRGLVGCALTLYVSLASPTFLLALVGLHIFTCFWLPNVEKDFANKVQSLEAKEKALKFPTLTLGSMKELYQQVYQLFRDQLEIWLVFFLSVALTTLMYGWFFPYEDFLSWASMIGIMVVSLINHRRLYQDHRGKQRWRQIGYLFLNDKEYDKIKA
jgi:hypothetical protein